jgi:hypothetical protein
LKDAIEQTIKATSTLDKNKTPIFEYKEDAEGYLIIVYAEVDKYTANIPNDTEENVGGDTNNGSNPYNNSGSDYKETGDEDGEGEIKDIVYIRQTGDSYYDSYYHNYKDCSFAKEDKIKMRETSLKEAQKENKQQCKCVYDGRFWEK